MTNGIIGTLAKSEGFPRISIYLPMRMKGDQCKENPIRLKNALRKVRERLGEGGFATDDIDALLAEAQSRVDDRVYWRHQNLGLAVFIEPGTTSFVKLPEEPPERVSASAHYHIRPLIRIMTDEGWFHLLTVTRDEARLYDVRRHDIHVADVEDMPEGVEQVRQRTDFQEGQDREFRAEPKFAGGSQAVGHGAKGDTPEDYQDTLLEHYVRDVAKSVEAHLVQSHAPLVLAAEPRVLGRLREALDYPHLAENAIRQDPASLEEDELRELGYEIARDLMDTGRRRVESRLRAWAGGDGGIKAGRSFEDLWRATGEGRLDTLFVAQGETVWGRVDEASGVPLILNEPKPDSEDLLNLLALRTLDQGGDVRRLPDDVQSEVGPMAGVYRY